MNGNMTTKLQKIVNDAIKLRNEMTEEMAVYRCLWIEEDWKTKMDSELYEFEEDLDSKGLAICVMPGFGRTLRIDEGDQPGKITIVPVTRVTVNLI
jgi:hypothetical protein